MHIVQLLPELNQGGVERGTVELSRELVLRGHRSTVISAGGAQVQTLVEEGGEHVRCDVCSKNPLTAPVRAVRLRRHLRRLKPDVIHARSRVPAWLAVFANRSLRIPFVTTVHGFNSVSAYSAVMTKGDIVVCGSTAVRRHVEEHYRVAPSRLRVIPRGVDTHYFDPGRSTPGDAASFRERLGFADTDIVVAQIGRITELKGHDVFLRALAEARRDEPRLRGLIVGGAPPDKGGCLERLRELANSLGLDQAAVFAGPSRDMRTVYAAADMVVSPTSAKPETFGRTVAEALAMNTPVVATAHGGVLDIVREGKDGFLFPPGDWQACAALLCRVATSPTARTRERIVREMSLETMTDSLLRVYREVAKPRG